MMICKIVRNEVIILVFLLLLVIRIDCSDLSSGSENIQELCSSNRYIYSVRPEETLQLKLTSNTTKGDINKWYQKSKRRCRKEFKTNNGAYHFLVIISHMSIPSCSEKCQCNYFEIAEPGNNEKFCGEHNGAIYFESKSDYLSIDFQHGLSMHFEVTLVFTVERNSYIITGIPRTGPSLSGHFIETPYFPNTYQSDYTSEYVLHTDAADGHVMLLFLDFQIASTSYIEVVGHNSTIPVRFNGDVFRPPVLVSQYNELNLKFVANNQPGRSGFRARCYHIKGADLQNVKPYTDCGGLKFGYGGSIILEKVENKVYDCLWHIVTPVLLQAKSFFLTVSNISLIDIGPNASLEFREGLNSKSKVVKNIDCFTSNCSQIPSEITVPAYSGLYVRFSGHLNRFSFIGMVYSTYHNGNCSLVQSNCQGRCLPPDLVCDGLSHCPDGSDEQECTKTIPETTVSSVEKKTTASMKAVAAFNVLLSFGICGLIVVFIVVFILFYRVVKSPPPLEQTEPPEVVREMSGPLHRAYSVGPSSDYLPSYEDFIQSSDLYPPLLYTRAAKRNSEPYSAQYNILHTTSFCDRVEPRPVHSAIDISSHSVPLETGFAENADITPEQSCSYERSNAGWTINNFESKNTKLGMKRAWSSDSKLDELSTSDCHLHLSITHCIYPHTCQCAHKQYNSLPINFKINNWEDNGINIIFPKNAIPKIDFRQNRHFSFGSNTHSSKILTIKTRCQSDPCQFSVHYSLRH